MQRQRERKYVKHLLQNNLYRKAMAFLVHHLENESTEEDVKAGLLNKSKEFVDAVIVLADQCRRVRIAVGKDKSSNSSFAMSIKTKLKQMLNAPLFDDNIFDSIYRPWGNLGKFTSPRSAFDVFIMKYLLDEKRTSKRVRNEYDFYFIFPTMLDAIRKNKPIQKHPDYIGFDTYQRRMACRLQAAYKKVMDRQEVVLLKPAARADMLEELFVSTYNAGEMVLTYDYIFQYLLGLPIEPPEPAPKPKKKPKRKAKQRQQSQQRKPAK